MTPSEQHARRMAFQRARVRLSECICELIKEYDLTFGELFALLADMQAAWAKHLVRGERDKPDWGDRARETPEGDDL